MAEQNYSNHVVYVPLFHYVAFPVAFLTFLGSGYHLYDSWGTDGQYAAALLVATNLALTLTTFFARAFAAKAQDRTIRLEERLRAQRLTGQDLDPALTVPQIIGLRFASDDEWPELCKRAVAENMDQKSIKQAIRNWKADTYRV